MADIIAKLAQIVTPTQLAFNAGSNKGVKLGDNVIFYRNVNIEDPDSKEPLGSVRVPRLMLKVSFLEDTFCVADMMTSDLDSPASPNVFATARVKVTTSTSTSRNTATVNIGEEVTIRSQGSTAGKA